MNRHGLEVRKRKGRKILNFHKIFCVSDSGFIPEVKWVGLWGQTPCPCSCWMCGNQRKYGKGKDKLTLKERLHLIDLKEAA